MQIEGLRVFCDLAESRSFTSAARINQITQSAVSQQMTRCWSSAARRCFG